MYLESAAYVTSAVGAGAFLGDMANVGGLMIAVSLALGVTCLSLLRDWVEVLELDIALLKCDVVRLEAQVDEEHAE